MRNFVNQYCPILLISSREKGLAEIVDLLCESMEAKIEQLEVEKSQLVEEKSQLEEEKSQMSQSILEKIPECPVNSQLRSQF